MGALRRAFEVYGGKWHMNEELIKAIEDSKTEVPTNLTWAEEEVGLWKSWTYSPKKNRYYFDDIGNESLTELWSDEFLRQAEDERV